MNKMKLFVLNFSLSSSPPTYRCSKTELFYSRIAQIHISVNLIEVEPDLYSLLAALKFYFILWARYFIT